MAVRITKPFRSFNRETVATVPAQLGVFELADADGVLYIGYAGGRSLFGLRSELADLIGKSVATRFRIEVNSAYQTRYRELLMVFRHDHGHLPNENDEINFKLGRLSPD